MRVVVEDANVLLDLVHGEVFALWLGMDYEHVTTHLVWQEVRTPAQRAKIQPLIEAGSLKLQDFAAPVWVEIVEFSETHRVSIADASVWMVARSEGGILLSGDLKLRRSSSSTGIDVRGVLWVLDELIEAGRINKKEGLAAMERMIEHGAFLPVDACEERRKRWAS